MPQFQKRHVKVVLYLPSALSKVTTRSLLCNERMLSTRVSNVARVSISNVLRLVGVVFGRSVAVVSGCRCRPNFGRMKFIILFWQFSFFSCSGRVDSRSVTVVTFSVIQLSVSLRVRHCRTLVPSGFIISEHGSGKVTLFTCTHGMLCVCVKTLHLGTVSICLALIF